jgi:hypothetical protein
VGVSQEQLAVGRRYFVYVTNASGLYRYEMNDIVEVAGHYGNTPLIRFVQKGKGVVSFTGEKLYEVQVIAAVDKALATLRGPHLFIAAVAELVDGVDAGLGEENDEYLTKRKSLRYGPPRDPGRALRRVRPVPPPYGGDRPAGRRPVQGPAPHQ